MALIEIRGPGGERLAAADDVSGAIRQLVDLVVAERAAARAQRARVEGVAALEADLSATAAEHEVGFRAGFRSCREAALAVLQGGGDNGSSGRAARRKPGADRTGTDEAGNELGGLRVACVLISETARHFAERCPDPHVAEGFLDIAGYAKKALIPAARRVREEREAQEQAARAAGGERVAPAARERVG